MISIDLDFPRASGKTTQLLNFLSKINEPCAFVCMSEYHKSIIKHRYENEFKKNNIEHYFLNSKNEVDMFSNIRVNIILCDECKIEPRFNCALMLCIGTKDDKDCYVGGRTMKQPICDTEIWEMCDKHLQVDFNIFFKGSELK